MRNFKYLCGSYILILVVGVSSYIIPVMYSMVTYCTQKEENSNIAGILASIALLIAGSLCVFVVKNQYGVKISENIQRVSVKIILLTIITAMFYVISSIFIIYKPTLNEDAELSPIIILLLVLASTIAPIGEELIYRFAMLTTMIKIADGRKTITAASMILVTLTWTIMHFSGSLLRNIDIIFMGVILTIIYVLSKNIILSILFHCAANAFTYLLAANYKALFKIEFMPFFSIPAFIICFVLLCLTIFKGRKSCAV